MRRHRHHPLTHSLTHSLTPSLPPALLPSLTPSLIHAFIHSFTHSLAHSDSLTCSTRFCPSVLQMGWIDYSLRVPPGETSFEVRSECPAQELVLMLENDMVFLT